MSARGLRCWCCWRWVSPSRCRRALSSVIWNAAARICSAPSCTYSGCWGSLWFPRPQEETEMGKWLPLPLTSLGLALCWLLLNQTLAPAHRSEEHTSELQSRENLVCRLLLEKKKQNT